MFLTETAKLATVVLPAASFAEKEGTFTNFEGRVNRVQKAIEPVGESLPDWEIILRLAEEMKCPLPFSSLQQVMDEIKELVPLYKGYTDAERQYQSEPDIWEARHAYGEQFLKGLAHFCPVEYTPSTRAEGGYPFTLISGTTLYHFGAGSRTSRAPRLKKFSPQAFVDVGELDAKELALSDGDRVEIISPISKVTTMVKITDTLPKGVFFMPASFPETPVNELFSITLDPEAKTPSLKLCNVRIEKISSPLVGAD
jgi:predicted molibdopterin-dependent oxidoreductase YjgC